MLKTVDRRAKRMKICDSSWLSYVLHMLGAFNVWFFEFSLGSFLALCKISDVKIFKRLLLAQFSSNFNQILFFNYVNGHEEM